MLWVDPVGGSVSVPVKEGEGRRFDKMCHFKKFERKLFFHMITLLILSKNSSMWISRRTHLNYRNIHTCPLKPRLRPSETMCPPSLPRVWSMSQWCVYWNIGQLRGIGERAHGFRYFGSRFQWARVHCDRSNMYYILNPTLKISWKKLTTWLYEKHFSFKFLKMTYFVKSSPPPPLGLPSTSMFFYHMELILFAFHVFINYFILTYCTKKFGNITSIFLNKNWTLKL